jgi:hypothetical protein
MPTRKQRRRNQKSRRHEYEYVYVDSEGNEVDVDPDELAAADEPERTAKPQQPQKPQRKAAASGGTPRRGMEPPSWRRSGRRALILGPIMVVALVLFNQKATLAEQVAPALFLVAFFIPFSYFTDSIAYKMYRKRVARSEGGKSAKASKDPKPAKSR